MNREEYKDSGLVASPQVSTIEKAMANDMLDRWHYLGGLRSYSLAAGHDEGCLVFSTLRGRGLKARAKSDDVGIIELARMVGAPGHGWSMSSLMAKAIKVLKQERPDIDIVVTYADPLAGHNGMVYRAASWERCDPTESHGPWPTYIIDGKPVAPRTLYARHGTSAMGAMKEIYGDRVVIHVTKAKQRYFKPLTKRGKKWLAKFIDEVQ